MTLVLSMLYHQRLDSHSGQPLLKTSEIFWKKSSMRYFFTFALVTLGLTLGGTFATASTIPVSCSLNVYTGQSNSGQFVVCGAFAVPANSGITDIRYDFGIDFQRATLNQGTASITAALNANGSADLFGIVVLANDRPFAGTVIVDPTDWTAFLTGGSIATSYVGASVAVTGATFDAVVYFTFEPTQTLLIEGGVPEPSSLALVGGALAIVYRRKLRR